MSELGELTKAMITLAESNKQLAEAIAAGGLPAAGKPLAGPTDTRPSKGDEKPISGRATRVKTEAPKEEAPAEDLSADEPTIAYDDIKALIHRLATEKSREVAIATMGEFKAEGGKPATKGPEIQPKDYEAFAERANAVLDAEDLA